MKQLFLLLAIFSTTLVFGQRDQHHTTRNNSRVVNPANSANPYDQVGEQHNVALNEILDNARRLNGSWNMDQVISYTIAALEKQGSTCNEENMRKMNWKGLLNSKNPLVFCQGQGFTNKAQNQVLQQLDGIIDKNVEANPNNFAPGIIADVKNLERRIAQNNNLNNAQKQQLLQATSVARFSSAYWQGNAAKIIKKIEKATEETPKKVKKEAKNIIKGDIAGAVGGGAAGAIFGPTALAGAGAGAVAGSVGMIAKSILDWFW